MPDRAEGRRLRDDECFEHEKRMDMVDGELKKQSGWFKASAGILAISIAIIGSYCTQITSKLDSIQAMLTDSKVVMMQHSEQIKNLDSRVTDIEKRHTYLDQNGVVTRVRK